MPLQSQETSCLPSQPNSPPSACAVDACLRLLPLLTQAHMDWRHHALFPAGPEAQAQPLAEAESRPGEVAEAAAGLFDACFEAWRSFLNRLSAFHTTGPARLRAAAAEEEAEPLWQVHTTVCRLLHWAAARDEEQQAALPALDDWEALTAYYASTLQHAWLVYHTPATHFASAELGVALPRWVGQPCSPAERVLAFGLHCVGLRQALPCPLQRWNVRHESHAC